MQYSEKAFVGVQQGILGIWEIFELAERMLETLETSELRASVLETCGWDWAESLSNFPIALAMVQCDQLLANAY